MSGNAQIDIRGNPTRRVIDLRGGAAALRSVPRAWDLSIVGNVVTLKNCCYLRGPVFTWLGDMTGSVATGDETGTWIGARINTQNGTASVVCGGMGSVSSDGLPTDEYFYLPLYKLQGASGAWSVAVDLRGVAVMLYV